MALSFARPFRDRRRCVSTRASTYEIFEAALPAIAATVMTTAIPAALVVRSDDLWRHDLSSKVGAWQASDLQIAAGYSNPQDMGIEHER